MIQNILTRSFPAGAGLLLAACATVPSGMASSDAPAIAPVLDRPDAVDNQTFARPLEARVSHVDLDLDLDRATRQDRLRTLLAELHLTPLAQAPAHTLSGGERRRAEITRALVVSPRFILLDEPFAGIDPIAVTEIQSIIFHLKERGIGVLVTDHNVRETLRITDRAYIVHNGVLFRKGTPASLAADADVRRIYLGADFRLD